MTEVLLLTEKVNPMWKLDKHGYKTLFKEAKMLAKENREICGLIIDTGAHLSLVRTRNISRRLCSFSISTQDANQIERAVKVLGQEIVGTFHSHPYSDSSPGSTDISGPLDDSLMLIFDCLENNGCLWKIKNGKARKLKFRFIQDR